VIEILDASATRFINDGGNGTAEYTVGFEVTSTDDDIYIPAVISHEETDKGVIYRITGG